MSTTLLTSVYGESRSALEHTDCFHTPPLSAILLSLICVLLIATFLFRWLTEEGHKHGIAGRLLFAAILCGAFWVAAFL